MKFGLKLWSTNDFYIEEAVRLYNNKIYDYIELFVVPNSLEYIRQWEELNIPFVLHAPHSAVGFNPSLTKYKSRNLKLLHELDIYRKTLNPKFIIFHPGIDGQLAETIRQFNLFKEKFLEIFSIALIENKPAIGLNGEVCVGSSVDDIIRIQNKTGMGFCYDIGHSIYYANSTKQNWRNILLSFLKLEPVICHLSDGYINSSKDMHLNYGKGNFDLKWIINNIENDVFLTVETEKGKKNNLNTFKKDIIVINGVIK